MKGDHTEYLKEVIRRKASKGRTAVSAFNWLGSQLRESIKEQENRIERFIDLYEGVVDPVIARGLDQLQSRLRNEQESLVDLEELKASGWEPE
ncbi:MAG: hypothetical protein U0835_00500 [Isosphaeraceae bacterium]